MFKDLILHCVQQMAVYSVAANRPSLRIVANGKVALFQ